MKRWMYVCAIAIFYLVATASRARAQTPPCPPPDSTEPCAPIVFHVPYPTEGPTVTVSTGAQLQNELNNATGAKTILLTPGTTYYPPNNSCFGFILPAITQLNDNAWIVIRSSSSVFNTNGSIPPNTQIAQTTTPPFAGGPDPSPGTLAAMPRLRNIPNVYSTCNSNESAVFSNAKGAHHYRLVGLDIGPDSTNQVDNAKEQNAMIWLGGFDDDTSSTQLPHDIVVDRSYVHGADAGEYKSGILLNGTRLAVIESIVSNIHDRLFSDSHAINGVVGLGPIKIVHNYIEGLGENVIFGGDDPHLTDVQATTSNIEFRRNYVTKRQSWIATQANEKNSFELKNADRVLVEGNIFENTWLAEQVGYAIMFKSTNQEGFCTWCVTQNVTFRSNIVRHVGGCFQIAGNEAAVPTQHPSIALNHVRIDNNVCDDIGGPTFPGSGNFAVIADGIAGKDPSFVKFIHNTSLTNYWNIVANSGVQADNAPNFTWSDNLTERHCYGVTGYGGEGVAGLNTTYTPWTWGNSALVNTSDASDSRCQGQGFPDATIQNRYPNPGVQTRVSHTWADTHIDWSPGAANPSYRLDPSLSPYAHAGTDGKDIGVDVDMLNAAFNGPGGSDGSSGSGGYTSQDVGVVGVSGSSSLSGSTWTVKGAGSDIWGSNDAFQFNYQQVTGDGAIIARVTDIQAASSFAKAGVMIRESLGANAAHVILDLRPTNDLEFMSRPSTGANTTFIATANQVRPVWLKLERAGSTFTASRSADGVTWTVVGSTTMNIATTAYWGLAVTSHDTTQLNTSTFDNVSITLSGFTSQDVGAVGQSGSSTLSGSTWTVNGAGADVWGTADAFQFNYERMTGDGTIVARVTAIENTSTFAKAGIMIRESLNANAAHVILDLRPTNDVELMTRPSTGAQTSYLAGATQAPPTWLKLQRAGSTITASVSANGTSWTTVGTATLNIAAQAYWGLVVTSHDATQLNTSTFDNVSVTPAGGLPHFDVPFSVPGTFQAEDFNDGGEGVAYHDNVAGNAGGQYRTSEDVDMIAATGNGSGYVVYNFETGEWLNYTISASSTRTYTVSLNVSSQMTGTKFHIEIDGVNVSGSVVVPNTGSWSTFQAVAVTGVNLTAGTHVLKVVSDLQYFNFDSVQIQ